MMRLMFKFDAHLLISSLWQAGILVETGNVSSIVEQENGQNLNHFIVDKFMTEVNDTTDRCIAAQTETFNRKVTQNSRHRAIKYSRAESYNQLNSNNSWEEYNSNLDPIIA